MGNFSNPVHSYARSGSRIVSQYQLPRNGTAAVLFGGTSPSTPVTAIRRVVAVKPADWTAVTSGYPDDVLIGNQTLYQADVAHNLGSEFAVCISIRDADGLYVTHQLYRQTNENPSYPGDKLIDTSRVWISADAMPTRDMYLLFVSGIFAVPPGGGGVCKVVTVAFTQWTAVTSGYPDDVLIGNQTLYQADVVHDLGNEFAVCVAIRDTSGLFITHQLYRQTNADPGSPGDTLINQSRLWISVDTTPASDLYLLFVC